MKMRTKLAITASLLSGSAYGHGLLASMQLFDLSLSQFLSIVSFLHFVAACIVWLCYLSVATMEHMEES